MREEPFAAGCAWIEGEYVPIAEARIPITETGFTRSDVVYDVVAVWKGRFFRLDDHLARFERSFGSVRMKPPFGVSAMREILFECVRRSGLREAYVEMIVSRGVPRPGVRNPWLMENRFYAYAIPYVWIVQPEAQEEGVHLAVARDTIRIPERSVDPTAKNFHWADLVRGSFEAFDRGAFTVVLPDAEGNITEGPGFNLFALVDGRLLTPASGVLQGITRQTVLDLAAEAGIEARLESFDRDTLARASEIFLTSTAGGVMPVTTLEGQPVGEGRPGPVTERLRARYWQAHEEERWTTPVDDEPALAARG